MLDAASSRRRRRSLFLWGVIVVSAAIAVVLGVVGYAEYHSTALDGVGDRSFLGLLYDSVRLLLVDWNISPDETLPKAIQMARLFALLSWGAAAVKGVFTLARRRIELIRCRPGRRRACGGSTSRASRKPGLVANATWLATDIPPQSSDGVSKANIASSATSWQRYPYQAETENVSSDSSRSAKPWKSKPSSRSKLPGGGGFRRPRTPARGVISSPPALPSAMLVRSDFSRVGSGNATGPARKGSCEIQRGSADPVRRSKRETRCAASRHNQLVPRNWALIVSLMG